MASWLPPGRAFVLAGGVAPIPWLRIGPGRRGSSLMEARFDEWWELVKGPGGYEGRYAPSKAGERRVRIRLNGRVTR